MHEGSAFEDGSPVFRQESHVSSYSSLRWITLVSGLLTGTMVPEVLVSPEGSSFRQRLTSAVSFERGLQIRPSIHATSPKERRGSRVHLLSTMGSRPFRSPLLRRTRLMFPSGTEMFHFPDVVSIGMFSQGGFLLITAETRRP